MAVAKPRCVPANPQGSSVAERDGDRTVVWLRGEHDVMTTAELSETLAQAIAVDDADLVVDLSHVQFIDASTIGVIVTARNFLLPHSRSLSLRAPLRCARRVLEACGLAELIDPGSPGPEAAGALGTWVAVPAVDRSSHRPGGIAAAAAAAATPTSAATAMPEAIEPAGEGATVPAGRGGP